jgi:hypothetical protein
MQERNMMEAKAVALRVDYAVPNAALDFFRCCYRFVNEEWQHAPRDDVPDSGFEKRFRMSCRTHLLGWQISDEREMHCGSGLETASGVLHELDIIAQHLEVTAILEAKNRGGVLPGKNDVIVLFAKILDYLVCNPVMLQKEICPTFMSNTSFDESGLAACLGLGIHPIAPGIRPVPTLVDNARRMAFELVKPIVVSSEVNERFDDFCAGLNNLSFSLRDTWLSGRCGSVSESAILMKSIGGLDTLDLANRLRHLNAEGSWLLSEVRKAIC